MRIRNVDFPEAILNAQRTNQLVIFAGAGVSVDAPSNYPDFETLARQIGGTVHPKDEGEAIDRYLGRLQLLVVKVHEQVRSILSSPKSRPNKLHESLVQTFRAPEQLRIVTTNFDPHFTAAAISHFGADIPEVFVAPALPLGSDFTGIVHLHGSVTRSAHRMVLSDSDFGRAYITDGWATKFLERLFAQFVVLFVGYSHQDMLLSYLARGLTAGAPGPGRFALTLPNDDARWKNLGITPVHYPVSDPPESKHSELSNALIAWAAQSQAGALAVEERIRTLASGPVPLAAEDRDFLEYALTDISLLRFFTRYARNVEWLQWLEGQTVFGEVFTLQQRFSELHNELAWWFAQHIACSYVDESLDLLRRMRWSLSPLAWRAIAHTLFSKKLGGQILSRWVAILLESPHAKSERELLEYILVNCNYPEDEAAAMLLLQHLLKPTLELKQSFRGTGDGSNIQAATTVDLDCAGSDYWLQSVWNSFIEPNIGSLAPRLASIVSSNLITAHLLLTSFNKVNTKWDPLSFSRGMIESRQQDHLMNGFSTLLDMGAAVVEWACREDSSWADALITQWFAADSICLKRLAIFCMASSTHISADDKLGWLIKNALLFQFGPKHEVFLVLKDAYPKASEGNRILLLKQAAEYGECNCDEKLETVQYEIFNFVAWLTQSDPGCRLAREYFASLQEQNPRFQVREHPDMNSWMGPVTSVQLKSPVPPERLTSYNLDQLLSAIEVAPVHHWSDTSRDGLLNAVTSCVRDSADWGIQITQEASSRGVWSEHIWRPVVEGWSTGALTSRQWRVVLEILAASANSHQTSIYSITALLKKGAQSSDGCIPMELLENALRVAEKLWPYAAQLERTDPREGTLDWLTRAINHPAGHLTLFYLHALSRYREDSSTSTERLFALLEAVVNGTSYGDRLGRVVISSQLQFLFHTNEDWTIRNVIPLLKAEADVERATQCWYGFLYWGHWADPMLPKLMPCYRSMFPCLDRLTADGQRTFCAHLAGIAVYATLNPLEDGWLFQFLKENGVQHRVHWASELHSQLRKLDASAKLNLWHRWLRRYWEQRMLGLPAPIHEDEAGELLDWALQLGEAFPEAVELLRANTYPNLGNSMPYYHIAESELLRAYPQATAKLLLFLTSGERGRPIYDLGQLRTAVEILAGLIPEDPILRTLCDELARLGVAGVSEIASRLVS